LGAFLVACGDDSSTTPGIPGFGSELNSSEGSVSSSSAQKSTKSSDSRSSEHDADGWSSSSVNDVPQSYAEAKVRPSGTYDCLRYKCTTTEYLNQEFLEAGKYGEILDERDGRVYKTVKIGEQVWMAQNLNYSDSVQTPSLLGKNWCYEDDPKKCAVTGRLYTWAAAIDSVKLATDVDYPQDCGYGKTCSLPAKVQGICPDGWHLPTESEWNSLFSEVGGVSAALGNLTSQTGCGWGFGMDTYGFSALPAGFRTVDGRFGNEGSDASFWSATEIDLSHANAYAVYLYSFDRDAYSGSHKGEAFSIRCLQD
jgi:uncharacterized protein (TIGR02145 family)